MYILLSIHLSVADCSVSVSICCRLQSFAGRPTLLGIISNRGQWATNLSVGEDASDHYVGLISVALK